MTNVNVKAAATFAPQGVSAGLGDVRGQTLERIRDLISRLPDGSYFATTDGVELPPSAVLDRLSAGYDVTIYKDDGKRGGWLSGHGRYSRGDRAMAHQPETFYRQATLKMLQGFESQLRTSMQSEGLVLGQ